MKTITLKYHKDGSLLAHTIVNGTNWTESIEHPSPEKVKEYEDIIMAGPHKDNTNKYGNRMIQRVVEE